MAQLLKRQQEAATASAQASSSNSKKRKALASSSADDPPVQRGGSSSSRSSPTQSRMGEGEPERAGPRRVTRSATGARSGPEKKLGEEEEEAIVLDDDSDEDWTLADGTADGKMSSRASPMKSNGAAASEKSLQDVQRKLSLSRSGTQMVASDLFFFAFVPLSQRRISSNVPCVLTHSHTQRSIVTWTQQAPAKDPTIPLRAIEIVV